MRQEKPDEPASRAAARELRTVSNALRVLEALADADRPLAVTELSDRLGLAASTTHRILSTLTQQGFAMRVPSNRRYRPGPLMTRLARRTLVDHGRLVDAGRPTLGWLAMESDETSHLAVLDGADAVSLDHVQSAQPVVAHHPVGSRVPAHATAVGQALLAHHPQVAARLVRLGLVRHTAQTITDPDEFEAILEEIRMRGFAVNVGQLHPETAGAAAPVVDESGAVIASIGISGPASRIGDPDQLERLGALAVEGAAAIGARLAALARRPDDDVHARS